MNIHRLSVMWLALAFSALAATGPSDPAPRTAKVIDTAGSESQVTKLIAGVDSKFGIASDLAAIAVITKDVEYAIPLQSVSLIVFSAGKQRTVKFLTKDNAFRKFPWVLTA